MSYILKSVVCGSIQLKTGVCVRRNGSGVRCVGKTAESQAPLFVCVRKKERGREKERRGRNGGVGTSGLEPNASTAFGIRGGEGCAMILDLIMGWVFISIKTEAKLNPLHLHTL